MLAIKVFEQNSSVKLRTVLRRHSIHFLFLCVFPLSACSQLPPTLQTSSSPFAFFKSLTSGFQSINWSSASKEQKRKREPLSTAANYADLSVRFGIDPPHFLNIPLQELFIANNTKSLVGPGDSAREPVGEIWARIQSRFSLDLSSEHKPIVDQRNRYLKNRRSLERVMRRAEPYLFHIVEEIEKRGLPMELALLPVVESSFDPFAYSHGRAAGIWQFIPSTGKAMGLEQNWWYDGRRDIVASTSAALTYLEKLNKRYDGDWLLTLAAYNSGMGTVSRAIRKNRKQNKPFDYWSLKLPKETHGYGPKFIALSQIIRDAERYGVELPKIPDQEFFKLVDTQGQIDLAMAAKLAKVELSQVYRLNPGLNRWATHPKGPHRLALPVNSVANFYESINALPANQRVIWTRYTVKSGDTLSGIAATHKTTLNHLKTANDLASTRIGVGKTLLIPQPQAGNDEYSLSSYARLKKAQNRKRRNKHKVTYRVKNGDSFWELSRKFNVSMQSIAKANGLAVKDQLRAGQQLAIWVEKPASSGTNVIRKVHYKVRNGDSLSHIASKFQVSVDEINTWNAATNGKYIQPGQKITLFVDIKNVN